MMKRRVEPSSLAAIDGVVALGIVAACTAPQQSLHHLHQGVISLSDCVCWIAFILLWRYCFVVLNLYDKLATMPSRVWTTLKGVSLMLVPVAIYFAASHRSLLTARALFETYIALFSYELVRFFFTGYMLDRLAARDPRRVIIIGSGRRAGKAWREIRTRYHSSIYLVGFVDDRDRDEMPPEVANRFIGVVDDLNDLILNQIVDVILIAMPIRSCYNTMQKAVEISEKIGVRVMYLGDIYSSTRRQGATTEILFTDLAPEQEHHVIRTLTKRAIDVSVSAVAIIVLLPVFALVALAIKLTSPGPVLFRQQRFGYRRRLFSLYKFRSMVTEAEAMLPELEHLNEAVGPIFKIRNDPRITKVGRLLRKTSLDELPQLWNVFVGDMSLVGPRPMSTRDVSLFNDAALLRRFSVKAGMTGLLQVNGRSDVSFDDWIAFDEQYIDQWSLLMDCRILLRTISAVFRRSGAF